MGGLILKILLILIGAVGVAGAAPTISTLTGTPGNTNSMTITGTGYEDHPMPSGSQKPMAYTNFEDQQEAPMASLSILSSFNAETQSCMSITSSSPGEGTYSYTGNLATECDSFSEAFIRFDANYGFPLSGHFIISVHRKNTSADTTENWKHWRTWALDDDILPDTWIGNAPADGNEIYTEACALDCCGSGSHTQDYFDYVKPNSTWQMDVWIGKRESTNFGTNGAFYSRQDGTLYSNTAWAWNCSGQDTAAHNMLEVEDDISNASTTGAAVYDNIYIDTQVITYVYFTNAATIAASTKFWMQPYTAMSTTEITIYQQLGDLGTNYDNVYVYVCQYESCSSGKQLSTAGAGGGGGGSSSPANRNMRGKLRMSGRVRT